MYAVIRTGGKQQKVRPGEVIEVEFMKTDPGTAIEFEPLMIMDDEGKPHIGKALDKAKVVGRPLGDKKTDKVRVFKYRPKSGYRRTQGHRQVMTVVEIEEIALTPDKVERKEEAEPQKEEAPAKKPAAKKTGAKKAAAKKPAAKKAGTKKGAAKKSSSKKTPSRKSSSAGGSNSSGSKEGDE